MDDKKLLKAGIIGTGFMSLCCFTPFLVLIVAGVGLSAIIGYLDYVLFPALGVFILLTAHALWKRHQRLKSGESCVCAAEDKGHA